MADYQVETIPKEPSLKTMDNLKILGKRCIEIEIQKLEKMVKHREIYFNFKDISMLDKLDSLVNVEVFDMEINRIIRIEKLPNLEDFPGLLSENRKLNVFQMSQNVVEFITDVDTVDHFGITQSDLATWKYLVKNNVQKTFKPVLIKINPHAKDLRYRSTLTEIGPEVLLSSSFHSSRRLLKE